ncbi:hypothetical protein QBC46DRAFT_410510 [Diplogelasinospora grovesii]|uniref:Apple domain-containing protein n=1 Tax=Diplogelasinospora grovesii TaxID=303347 RepID=A0AAN6N4H7_9PEZI|nr:hypothetical protein QBC46DRAFT_410510 [Diplogelasinospora grovesii]
MKTFTAIVALAAFFSAAAANPMLPRAQMCNQTPTASNAGNTNTGNANGGNNNNNNNNNNHKIRQNSVQAISTPTAATGAACQQQCKANTQCQSFVFGLPPTGSTPTCMLFAVPASEVPNQGTDLNVFDEACTSVPTQAPTHSQPQGQ